MPFFSVVSSWVPDAPGQIFEAGGPEVLTYAQMMKALAVMLGVLGWRLLVVPDVDDDTLRDRLALDFRPVIAQTIDALALLQKMSIFCFCRLFFSKKPRLSNL